MKPSLACLIAAAVVALASCSPPKTPDPAALEASASARILAIPPAAPEKYRGMRDMKGWRNPYLILRADGVALLDPENHLERILKPGELTQALGNLPPSAWPYGRVVAVSEGGVHSSTAEDEVKVRTNRALVAGTLESMHVLIHWIPSA
ncbi:MAG: hypothetical protein WBQ64_09145 [Terriglobales bacterium]